MTQIYYKNLKNSIKIIIKVEWSLLADKNSGHAVDEVKEELREIIL